MRKVFELHKLWAVYETAKILTFHPQYLTKTLSCIIPITMLLRVFETPLLNILLGLCPLFTPSNFWRRYSQLSHADTDYNATDLELSYRFSIDRVSIKGATLVDTIWLIIANLPSAKASHLICIAQCHNCAFGGPDGTWTHDLLRDREAW